MIIATSVQVEGKNIVKTIGLVKGSTIRAIGIMAKPMQRTM